ncbi:MAG: adenylate/guanylate cyclase domain-containing protein, partial [Rhodospirillaceae bacterium]|nr:adenylate/guanylate cyclase domain-containing protein [Rhodospirillaceae bacterium]
DYRAGVGAFARYTVAEVMDGKTPPDAFAGKAVVIGVGSESVKDFFLTPLERSASAQPLYGAELHAHLVAQFLRLATQPGQRPIGSFGGSFSGGWEMAMLLLWCAVGTCAGFTLRSPVVFAAGLIVGLGAIGGFAFLNLREFIWLPSVAPATGWLVSAFASTSYVSYRENKDRQAVMGLFARHVSRDVAQELWRQRDSFMDGNVPKSQRVVATVLFSDLKGFTSVSENAEPEQLMEWLNNYMDAMTEVIGRYGGVIDKFIGDAIMVVFGIPRGRLTEAEQAADAEAAVTCALAMSARLQALNAEWRAANKPEVGMRIGIHTGPLVAGALGGKERIDYTVIGDTVNTASRFESYDKSVVDPGDPEAVSRIIIGATTKKLIGGRFKTTEVGAVTVKGKQEPLTIYLVPLKQD